MGFEYGNGSLSDKDTCFKLKYRWEFFIKDLCGEDNGSPLLPPSKAARPSLSFKEMDAVHLTETVYFPGRPEWKPINLTLYDIKKNLNPVIKWLQKTYLVTAGGVSWSPSCGSGGIKINECRIVLYDGVGNDIETWILENVWPNNIEFGDLDYGQSDVLTVDLTLRYDRAYIKN